MLKKLKYYLFLLALIREKERDLWRAQFDINYFDTVKGDQLKHNYEEDIRKAKAREQKKEEPDMITLYKYEKEIAEIKALKQIYSRQHTIVKEMPGYLNLIRDNKNGLYFKKKK